MLVLIRGENADLNRSEDAAVCALEGARAVGCRVAPVRAGGSPATADVDLAAYGFRGVGEGCAGYSMHDFPWEQQASDQLSFDFEHLEIGSADRSMSHVAQ